MSYLPRQIETKQVRNKKETKHAFSVTGCCVVYSERLVAGAGVCAAQGTRGVRSFVVQCLLAGRLEAARTFILAPQVARRSAPGPLGTGRCKHSGPARDFSPGRAGRCRRGRASIGEACKFRPARVSCTKSHKMQDEKSHKMKLLLLPLAGGGGILLSSRFLLWSGDSLHGEV